MLLVLSNGGYLAPPDESPDREQLWNETWKRINRFQPNLFTELFPEEAGKPAKPRQSKDARASKDERREMDVAERETREVPSEKVEDEVEEEKDSAKGEEKEG
jgi:brefeldin A-resistance guanine nucleotide exchange factor 1